MKASEIVKSLLNDIIEIGDGEVLVNTNDDICQINQITFDKLDDFGNPIYVVSVSNP